LEREDKTVKIMVALLVLLVASTSLAVRADWPIEDSLGFFQDEEGYGDSMFMSPFTAFWVYALYMAPSAAEISGFEFGIYSPGATEILEAEIIGVPLFDPDSDHLYVVQYAQPRVTEETTTLARFYVLYTNAMGDHTYLHPVRAEFSPSGSDTAVVSLPDGGTTILDCEYGGLHINVPFDPVHETTWDNVKAIFR
jgi:hypothetical protein